MTVADRRLVWAAGVATYIRPSEALAAMRSEGPAGIEALYDALNDEQRSDAELLASELSRREVDVLVYGDGQYPESLLDLRRPPPIVFWAGSLSLLDAAGVGMCGSRNASDRGLRAARTCGMAVAQAGMVVISGNARGVDTESHVGALEAGGGTVLALAEGILRYRQRRSLATEDGESRVLVLSQFAPRASWNVGNAMTRNGLIAALGQALVVIEARGEGGTLDAGLQGLHIGRPVIALEFERGPTPPGNAVLHGKGAIPVRSAASLTDLLARIRESWVPSQLTLPLSNPS